MWSLRPWNQGRKDYYLDPFDSAKSYPLRRGRKRRSELALSEVEGVNPEQTSGFRLGSRRVDFIIVI